MPKSIILAKYSVAMKLFFLLTTFTLSLHLCSAEHEVKGRVLSLQNTGIGGVNVILKGTPVGTVTDMNGRFKIVVPEGPVVLLFSLLKSKSFEHAFHVRPGYQYEIKIFLANRSQTFNKSYAMMGELPLDCPVVEGSVSDQRHRKLATAIIEQNGNAFSAVSDAEGKFRLPVPYGSNILSFSLAGFKSLEFSLDVRQHIHPLSVTLVEDKSEFRKMKSFATSP